MSEAHVSVDVAQQARFCFEVAFAGTTLSPVLTDEPPPLGDGRGPNPVRLLAAAVASCLAASLLFALKKQRVDPQPVTAHIDVDMVQNDAGRVRVGAMAVRLSIGKTWADLAAATRALDRFDAYCVVAESLRAGIPIAVDVCDANGATLECAATDE
ncbi:peroxiredoxin [Burkholderia stabilis]|uniref:Peroxiredoxin, OsmC subfamily,OsmC-like protein n=1 Tax=Burkholderia stabilis TaxID=95485 RepID=A0AAJ5N8Z4_9BURK|nr:OsmC family protein [Burkholderia stabilis]AOR70076.1 peroxiredoxin [Burkholderia stabilis]VBB14006.1 peroxiredoxin, OsmC subfamily,OsmC-like protein [Burkholderia stabilis]HDR9489237.1 OsmC family protein [Burkholderia stabilis]HDR9522133.1 OsmC family protein [Burkholderia stabilis]HDR9529192.1 OsmC family protein [Burkholderia stabilis]